MADEIELRVGGRAYLGWETIEVLRSIEAVCAGYSLAIADLSQTGARGGNPLRPGVRADLYLGRELILSGYIDAVEAGLGSREHAIRVFGRDLAADLVDCTPLGLPSEFYDVGILDLAIAIAAPFGISVEAQEGVDLGRPFERFSLQPTETGREALERAARPRGLLLQSTPEGRVVLSRAGAERAEVSLVQGEGRLAEGRARLDLSDRYRRYVVLGQRAGSDLAYGSDVAEILAAAEDPIPRATRTLAIQAEGSVDDEAAQVRATWEANVRAARGSQLSLSLPGWRESGDRGRIWRPGVLVPVSIPSLEISGDWLVAGVRLSRSLSGGSVAELGLVLPDSYLAEPPRPDREPAWGADLEDDSDR